MAREDVDVQTVEPIGLAAVYDPVTMDGIAFVNDSGAAILHVKNGSGVTVTVTVQSVGEVDGIEIGDMTIAIPSGGEAFAGTFAPDTYNQGEDPDVDVDFGKVYVDFSAATSVTVAVLEVV